MNENHTLHNQLILYVFNELSPSESASFEHQLISDSSLQEEHRIVSSLIRMLQVPVSDRRNLRYYPSPQISLAALTRLEVLMGF